MKTFAFYCPRCQRPIGKLQVEGVMLAIWWLDADGAVAKKWGVKTLKSGEDYLNLLSVSPSRPSATAQQTTITLTARQDTGQEQRIERSAVEVFAQVSQPEMQEWQIQ
ncbi:MAG: hypothetical protein WCF57_19740 [Pyrinomonadaceae bacterium]